MGAEFIKKEYRVEFVSGWGINVTLSRKELAQLIREKRVRAYRLVTA